MMQHPSLRPLERRVLRLADEGVDDVEIAWRFRRSPRFVRQVKELAAARMGSPPPGEPPDTDDGNLRPLERRVLFWRSQGLDHEELAPRFRHSAAFLEQVERLARFKLGR